MDKVKLIIAGISKETKIIFSFFFVVFLFISVFYLNNQILTPRGYRSKAADRPPDTVHCLLSLDVDPLSFFIPAIMITKFGSAPSAGGWASQNLFPRALADVNNDGKADIVGFANNGVYVSLSGGTTLTIPGTVAFGTMAKWSTSFGSLPTAGSWKNQDITPRTSADVNNDGKSDIIGFGGLGVYVSLSSGTSFGAMTLWIKNFGSAPAAGSWASQNIYPRTSADVNGDGRSDIVGFAKLGVYVSLSTGTTFGPMTKWSTNFGTDAAAGGWETFDKFPRTSADVNGDGRADIVGFGGAGVYVALAQGSASPGFGPIAQWSNNFGFNPSSGSWASFNQYPRYLKDINNDNKADIVGFASNGVFVSLSTGTSFGPLVLISSKFGFSPPSGGWTTNDQFPRTVADVNNDGKTDIVGFAGNGTMISVQR